MGKRSSKDCDLAFTFDLHPINQSKVQVKNGSLNYLANLQLITCTCQALTLGNFYNNTSLRHTCLLTCMMHI